MQPLAIAHRAGNSLAGLQEANQVGADVIECDVRRGRERLEVRHLKSAGPLPFLWDRWELVAASAPRLGLHEILAAQQHGTTFMLDVKGRRTDMVAAVAECLRRGPERDVLACGRYWPAIEELAELPYVRAVLSARNRTELARLRRRVAARRGRTPAVHGVSVHRSLLTGDLVAELHRSVQVVMTWPVNDVSSLDTVLELGVSGVISDESAVLAELVRRRG